MLGYEASWKPWYPEACAQATNNDMSCCTNAFCLRPFVKTPMYFRENVFDYAKIGPCGQSYYGTVGPNNQLDLGSNQYVVQWGKWLKSTFASINNSEKDGFYVTSCTDHTQNADFETSPVINDVPYLTAFRNWFFELNDDGRFLYDDCGDLPCTQVRNNSKQVCTRLDDYAGLLASQNPQSWLFMDPACDPFKVLPTDQEKSTVADPNFLSCSSRLRSSPFGLGIFGMMVVTLVASFAFVA